MRRKTRRGIAIGVAALSCFLVVAYVFSESKTRSLAENSPRNEKSELVRLLENHCNTVNALENIHLPESSEGTLQNAEIRQIQVVTRHGDRSAIFTTPMTHSNRFRCPRESDYTKTSESSPLSPCRASQLTRTGCEQHRKLGNFFKRAYGLSNENLKSKMRISSTRYQRTIKSAECLVSGLLGDESFSQSEIHLTSSNYFATSDDTDTDYLQRCPRLNSIWARLKLQSKYVTMATRWDAIRRRVVDFAGGRSDLSLTAIGDTVYTHYCHLRKSLGDLSVTPCLSPGHCLPEPLTLEVVEAYDECTTFNYTEEVSILLIQPLVSQIVAQMESVVLGKSDMKFVHYSGHDVTLMPLLVALGGWKGRRSPYASRIVFELWRQKEEDDDDDCETSECRYRVRILYNGKALSRRGRDVFSFGEFRTWVLDGPLRTVSAYRKACMTGSLER